MKKTNRTFNQLSVGIFESRRQVEMGRLIQNAGGKPVCAPSIEEVPLQNIPQLKIFGEKLISGQLKLIVLMTGVGTRRLIQTLFNEFSQETILPALKKVTLLARGPKPISALGEFGLKPQITVPEPNTWREILKIIDHQMLLDGISVGIQEYGESNRLFLGELAARGAVIFPIQVYQAKIPTDKKPLQNMAAEIVSGNIPILLFTNAAQVDHLMAVAKENGTAQELRDKSKKCAVASIGPTCTEKLIQHGFNVDLESSRPQMGAFVMEMAAQAAAILKSKQNNTQSYKLGPNENNHKAAPLSESLFMKACRREPVHRTPIWLMRQAGRYMKEYRELRSKVSFLDLCKDSDLASEVTVDAAHRLGVDAAIIFSDILILLEPFGFQLSYGKDSGPVIGDPFRKESDLKKIKEVDPHSDLGFVLEAIRKTRKSLKPGLPLIGFAGAPFTVASYLIEGKGSKNFSLTKKLMAENPKTWHQLMEKLTTNTMNYLNAQIETGAQVVQIFDSWVGCLTPEDFRKFVFPYSQKLTKGITPGVPVINFGTNNSGLLPLFAQLGGDVVGVDWRIELDEAWKILNTVAIQGNLDPVVLLGTKGDIEKKALRILKQAHGRPGHIFNLGHGVLPDTPIENVLHLINVVKSYNPGRES